MPKVRDIAEVAEVSIGTVSRVLNNQPHVSQALRTRVLKVVNELRDSKPGLGSSRPTTSIALVYSGKSSLNSPYDSAILHGIAEKLDHTDHDLMVVNAARGRGPGESLGQMLLRRGVAGALLRTTALTHNMVEELAEEGFPAVSIADRVSSHKVGSVVCDGADAIEHALEHLASLGHQRIAIALDPVDDFDHARRLEVYQRFLQKAGLPSDDRWIVRKSATQFRDSVTLHKIMSMPDRPTAVFITDPLLASDFCTEAARSGIRIPDDISVIGFDDTNQRFGTFPRLSSVCQDAAMLGQMSLDHLMSIIDRKSVARELTLKCTFEPLDSTAPPPGADCVDTNQN